MRAAQYAVTLAPWYGLGAEDRADLFPNLEFMQGGPMAIDGADLGFMG